jgi:8-oxo-dGTP pyrophosphatase MutT (NUDIX family)
MTHNDDNKTKCAGVIVLRNNECVIVTAESKESKKSKNHGFPKGKAEKGESVLQTALRELDEETGIKPEQLLFAKDKKIYEITKKNVKSVTYYIAKCTDEKLKKFTFNAEEIQEVVWYKTEDALEILTIKNRREILHEAVEIINDSSTVFVTHAEL